MSRLYVKFFYKLMFRHHWPIVTNKDRHFFYLKIILVVKTLRKDNQCTPN